MDTDTDIDTVDGARLRHGPLRPDLLPTVDELALLRRVAIGQAPADLIVRGGSVLAVHTGEFLERDVVISGRHIAAVTPVGYFDCDDVVDATGRFVVPGFIDAHLHIEWTMLTPGELARVSVPRGTTTVLADPDGMANVAGVRGMDFMLETGTPLRIFEQVSQSTPVNRSLERGGAVVPEQHVLDRLDDDRSVALGAGSPHDLSDVATNRLRHAMVTGKRIAGYSARHDGEGLWGYLAAGVGDDHNSATIDEVLERARLGAMVTLMSGSMNDNTVAVFSDLERVGPALGHMAFCADDKHVLDLVTEGHIDHHVRQAIAAGIPAAQAYRMATWQPAAYYRLDHIVGSVAPGRLADLLVIDDLALVVPSMVVVGGEVAAVSGVPHFDNTDPVPGWLGETMHVPVGFEAARLAVAAAGDSAVVQAMEMYDGYVKRAFHVTLPVVDGTVRSDPSRDVLKIAVIDRHHGDGQCGVGFVRGFGIARGALAVSINCANANIVAVGARDDDIAAAVEALREQGGGFVVVDEGVVTARVTLPVGGMMSAAPWEQTAAALSHANDVAFTLGCRIRSPFMVLSFVGLAVVPDLGLTELGLIDGASQTLIDLVLSSGPDGIACWCPDHDSPVHAIMDDDRRP
jgi:adenine deaminase